MKPKPKTFLFVSTFVLLAGLVALDCKQEDVGPVDLIVYNGNVYLADGTGKFAEAVAVQGNRILRVGSNRDIERLRQENTRVIDAEGGAVVLADLVIFSDDIFGLPPEKLLDAVVSVTIFGGQVVYMFPAEPET